MQKFWLTLATGCLLAAPSARAGLFNEGIGGAMYYGPYTGGHYYSYNVAYGYGFAFSPADTWRRDIFAYPGGPYPYRPYGWPIYCRVWPNTGTPYISAPGPDGLKTLVPAPGYAHGETLPGGLPALAPVPTTSAAQPATIKISVPAHAQVWFDREVTTQTGQTRVFQSPPLPQGKTHVYTVRARWNEAGREVEQHRIVGVRAGETARLTFTTAQAE
jgi:uncharacterized protein (TIGR03000 family)